MARQSGRFGSRVDWWLGVILAATPLVALGAAVFLQLSGDAVGAMTGWLVLAGTVALYAAVVWPVYYELTDSDLVIRFGLARSRIPYGSIRGVAPTRSILASPALSLDRLAIDTGATLNQMISPADRDGFLDRLAARTPHLVRDGDRLVPRPPA